ncbi:MAG: ComEC/Rec2 family competence protein [Eubacteriales bacterium]|nr:ComEC/Rec2 family competence protein [Eubacteriales bacterium]
MNQFSKRPFSLILLFFSIASFVSTALGGTDVFYLSVSLFLLSVFTILIGVITIINKNHTKTDNCKTNRTTYIITFAICVLSASLAFSLSYIRLFRTNEDIFADNSHITARIDSVLYSDKRNTSLAITISSINGKRTDANVIMELDGTDSLSSGDTIEATANIRKFLDNNRGFDENSYYLPRGYVGYAYEIENLSIIESTGNGYNDIISTLREKFAGKIKERVPGESGNMMCALLLGESRMLSHETKLAFSRTGLSHALALSGMHLSVLAAMLSFVLKKFRVNRFASVFILLFFVSSYVLLTGASPSILRAAIMNSLVGLAFILGRPYDNVTALFVSVALILLFRPYAAYDVGLMLSALSTFGIITACDFIRYKNKNTEEHGDFEFSNQKNTQRKTTILSEYMVVRIAKEILKYVFYSFILTMGALIFTMPIICIYFGYFSLAALPSNLIFAPLIEVYLYFSVITLIFPIPAWVSGVFSSSGNFILSSIKKISDMRNVCISISHPIIKTAIALFSIIIVVLVFRKLRKRAVIISLITSLTALCVVLTSVTISEKIHPYEYFSDDLKNEHLTIKYKGAGYIIDFSRPSIYQASTIVSEMSDCEITDIEAIFVTAYYSKTADMINRISRRIKVYSVYFPSPKSDRDKRYLETAIDTLRDSDIVINTYDTEREIQFGEMRFMFIPSQISENNINSTAGSFHAVYKDCVYSYLLKDRLSHEKQEFMLKNSDTVIFGGCDGDEGVINLTEYTDLPDKIFLSSGYDCILPSGYDGEINVGNTKIYFE